MSHAVIIKNAVKKYGDFTALNGVSLDIKQGEFFTLLGPSGCGKTTLLRMIAGFNTVDGGEICFDDRVINNLEAHKRDIGMVFQNYAIFPHLTVAENVAFGLRQHTELTNTQIKEIVQEKLDLVELPNTGDYMPSELSGGMKKRISLARAIALNPRIILYDEPTSGLDPITSGTISKLIRSMQKHLHCTSIVVTHDMQSAFYVANRIALLDKGKFIEVSSPTEFRKSKNKLVQQFIHGGDIMEDAGEGEKTDEV